MKATETPILQFRISKELAADLYVKCATAGIGRGGRSALYVELFSKGLEGWKPKAAPKKVEEKNAPTKKEATVKKAEEKPAKNPAKKVAVKKAEPVVAVIPEEVEAPKAEAKKAVKKVAKK